MADEFTSKLAAYLDGELSSDEMKAMDAHVRNCPSCAADALGQVQMKRAVQSAGKRYAPSADFRARIQGQIASRPTVSIWNAWLTTAAVVALLVIASIAAVYLGQRRVEREQAFSELADLHLSTLASANPVDVLSTDRHTVKPWFQGKLPFTFNLPELHNSSFSLLGGRVTYLGQAPGAQLIYQIGKHQISVFIFQDRNLKMGSNADSGVRKRHSFEVDTWSQDGLRYVVIGDAGYNDVGDLVILLKDAAKS
jgi:anti-sigma factor RsiW